MYNGPRNRGRRNLSQAGELPNGVPWIMFSTEGAGDGPDGYVSDIYTHVEGRWRPAVLPPLSRRAWVESRLAISCPSDADGLTIVEATWRPLTPRKPTRYAAVRWGQQARSAPRPLGFDVFGMEQGSILCHDDHVTMAGTTGTLSGRDAAFGLWRISPPRSNHFASFEHVRVDRNDATMDRGSAQWGVRFSSVNELVLWRVGSERLRFRFREESARWEQNTEDQPTPEERGLEAVGRLPGIVVTSVATSPSDGSVWMALKTADGAFMVVTDRARAATCFGGDP